MKKIIYLFSLMFIVYLTNQAETSTDTEYNKKTIKVAVIDTGFDFKSTWAKGVKKPKLCNYGHKDFTGEGLQDTHGHGTHVSGIIGQHAKGNYCLVILKFFIKKADGADNLRRSTKALQYALNIKVDVVNFSGGGPKWNSKEYRVVNKLLTRGTKLVFAAGNEGKNVDNPVFRFFPASYDSRIFSVGSLNADMTKAKMSNYGKSVSYWEIGNNVLSLLLNNKVGRMSGTSQATAVKTGKIIKNWYK